ncbi:hypothetical protein OG21DRAFT_1551482 [Imleria badia]|nr:hypothetical protein OG21DRAFT_1551482 [Imleria badia]
MYSALNNSEAQVLKSNNHVKLATWQQILQAGVDALIISEHSFHLAQQNDPQPISSAAQRYSASSISAQVKMALKGVFQQYREVSEEEKVDMIFNLIMQNHMAIMDLHSTYDTLVNMYHVELEDNEVQALSSNNPIDIWGKIAPWHKFLQAGVDATLILEHSFHLSQQNDPQPATSAIQKYHASNIPARVKMALKDVVKQYSKVSEKEKENMIFNMQNCMPMGHFNGGN